MGVEAPPCPASMAAHGLDSIRLWRVRDACGRLGKFEEREEAGGGRWEARVQHVALRGSGRIAGGSVWEAATRKVVPSSGGRHTHAASGKFSLPNWPLLPCQHLRGG